VAELPVVRHVYPSDANFLLVKVQDARAVYHFLVNRKIIVRDRSNVKLCEGCLRISVGTAEENGQLLAALREFGAASA
jgi:histidinol-phosphate aminotransferase